MRISLIIPTRNAGTCLANLLSMIRAQDTKPSEVIIIDSSSEDNTVEIAERFGAKALVIPRKDFNHGTTRNTAAMEARGDILVFMTQDALPADANLLTALTGPLSMPDIAAAYGRQIQKDGATPLEVFTRRFNYPDIPMTKGIEDIGQYGIKTFSFSDVCSAIKKDPFREAGMFSSVRANEDMLIAARLIINGYKVSYVPDAQVIHSHHYSLRQQFKRYYNIGSSLNANRWILRYARAEGEGLRFIGGQIRFVLEKHRYRLVPYILLEAAAKYAGYRIGLRAG
jgi:rhamnosyltransferase